MSYPIIHFSRPPAFNRQEQNLRDVKVAAEEAQLVLAEDAKRSTEALKAKRSLVLIAITC